MLMMLVFAGMMNAQVPTRAGWWKFDDAGDMLKAEVGSALALTGTQTSVAGPADGNLATEISVGSYLTMTHGIAANGGGAMVNEYTVQLDVMMPVGNMYHSLWQTDPANSNDAEMFLNSSNQLGAWRFGYSDATFAENTWYRVVVSVKNGEFYKIFVNGELWVNGPGMALDDRDALASTLLLFADEDGEDNTMVCSEAAIWDVALTNAQAAELGNTTTLPMPERVGLWKFDDAGDMLKAEIGTALTLTGSQTSVAGPEDGNLATEIGVGSNLAVTHGIAANGGGSMVNEYSVMLDLLMPAGGVWHSIWQTDPANSNDGDLFLNGSDHIGASRFGYSDRAFVENMWYRVVVTVENGSFYKIYVNGNLWLDGAGQDIDSRDALASTLLLFCDEDGEDNIMQCAEAAMWAVALTADEVSRLGGYPENIFVEQINVTGTGGATTIETVAGTLQMLAEVLPENATNKDVEWSVENGTGSATISETGLLTAENNGVVTVKATAVDGSDISGSLEITISNQPVVLVDSIYLTTVSGATEITSKGGTLQMVANILPANASDKSVVWTVNNVTGNSTLTEDGLLTAVADGEVVVKATSRDGSNVKGTLRITISNQTAISERKGWWKFDDANDMLKAEIGQPLVLSGSPTSVSGPVEGNFATKVPLGSYFTMNHGIAANGGGTMVNEWSLQIDFSVAQLYTWYSFIQTNDGDADLFVAKTAAGDIGRVPNSIGSGSLRYSPDTIVDNKWYRMILSVKNGSFFRIYMDGALWYEALVQEVDGRYGLGTSLQIFQDDDGDDGEILCSELAIWDVALTSAEIESLGTATQPYGINEHKAGFGANLGQNYPNPVNAKTIFPYTVTETSDVNFRVMDMTGKVVATYNEGMQAKGNYSFELNVSDLAAGIYYVMLDMNGKVSTRKMSVVK